MVSHCTCSSPWRQTGVCLGSCRPCVGGCENIVWCFLLGPSPSSLFPSTPFQPSHSSSFSPPSCLSSSPLPHSLPRSPRPSSSGVLHHVRLDHDRSGTISRSTKLRSQPRYCFLFSKHLLITTRTQKKPQEIYRLAKVREKNSYSKLFFSPVITFI